MVLRNRIAQYVEAGDFGLASGQQPAGSYSRVWWKGLVPSDEITFDAETFLLTKARATALKAGPLVLAPEPSPEPGGPVTPTPAPPIPGEGGEGTPGEPRPTARRVRVFGTIPPEIWNRLGTRLLPKIRQGTDVKIGVDFSATVDPRTAESLQHELLQALDDLGLRGQINIEDIEVPSPRDRTP